MPAPTKADLAKINNIARAMIKAKAVPMCQVIQQSTIVPANTPLLTINPRNVGLIRGFWIKVVHSISNASAVQINLTDFGPANSLSQITFNDLQNLTRVQTAGWHLAMVNSAKARRPFGAAFVRTTGFDSPIDYGAQWTGQIAADATIAAEGTGTVTMWYYVPLAYSDDDLRGSVYANVVNATMQLILSMPGSNGVQVAVANGTDSTLALYVGNVAGDVSAVTITSSAITVYQDYLDQLPVYNNGLPMLPVMDLATVYEIKNTSQTGFSASADFPYQYANFRDFLATFLVYVQASATGARGVGADINYFSLQAANATNLWKKAPDIIALQTRNFMGVDLPNGTYYFGSRMRPISTIQYGNMQLINNPLTVGAGAYQLVGIEAFALQQSLSMGGSLASN